MSIPSAVLRIKEWTVTADAPTACYSPWLKVRVLIRAALTMLWSSEDWAEIHEHPKWLLAEESQLRRQGWLN